MKSAQKLFKYALQYWQFTLTVIVGIGSLIIEFGLHDSALSRWIIAIFCTFIGVFLLVDMIKTLRGGNFGVDILAITAIAACIAVGQYWAGLVIVLMLTGGETLEDYAANRARRELTALLKRAPKTAHIYRANRLITVDVDDIRIGDKVLIRPAEVVPVDGTLRDNSASFDESSLTGESLPVEMKRGDSVMSGSLNGASAVTITATALAKDSQYAQIIRLVRDAESQPAPFVRLADRYAIPFTLISYLIASIAWFVSRDPVRFAEVLVVASPCPLILAAPIAFISGMSQSSKHGVIVKNGRILEKLANVKSIAFDKTGTLTHGDVAVDAVQPASGFSEDELLLLAASAEASSSHILAQSIVKFASKKHVKLLNASKVNEIAGDGISARVDGRVILVGKPDLLVRNKVKLAKDLPNQTLVAVAVDGKFAGMITFTDHVRSDAKNVIAGIHDLGVKNVMMLTGDRPKIADEIARKVGIDHYHAECLPADKVKLIGSENVPRPIAMIGDGVNDAPVLAAADVGIAMGARGSTATSESADVVVMKDDLSRVPLAMKIARRTMKIAKQSVLAGIIICLVLELIASTGVIPALLGAGFQELVDVIVIFNALRAHGGGRASAKNQLAS